ncbi:MAG: sulfatase-like hydrolase/transferase [Myxococcota bacterium]|nr:sulfatase-like hydrolase/transferase [Myxococcota bacterium]
MSLLLWLACTGAPEPQPEPEAAPRPSLLLVTLDTTRADALGAYGHSGAQTPVFDSLAGQGVRFERAYATVPLTTPSHASMLTGLYPTRHGIHNNGDAVLRDDVDTLAELLGAQGYRSAASASAFVTTATWNLDQGFDAYFDEVERSKGSRWEYERPANEVVDDLLGWLPQGEEPFFMWAHFYDAHAPYQDHAEFDLATPYDEEIAFADQQLGRLLEAAQAKAGPGGLAVIVVADHGEAFGEHDETGHGLFVYDSTMRIPFVAVPPERLKEGVVFPQAVSNVDVTPTALGLLGLTVPQGLDGRDLSVAKDGALQERGPVYMESEMAAQRFGFHPELAVAAGVIKLIDTPQPLLFDVQKDPKELQNLAAEQPETVSSLHGFRMEVWAQRQAGEEAAMTPELMEQLAALGYVGGTSVEEVDYSQAPDAKANMAVIQAIESARELASQGKAKESIQAYQEVLKTHPDLGEALAGLARAQAQVGDHAAAEATWRRAMELAPDSTFIRTNLAQALAAQGRLEDGLALMRSVHEQVPGDELARSGMLKMLIDLDRYEEAVSLGQEWLAAEPEQPSIQAFTGIALTHMGQVEPARTLLEASLNDGMPRQLVHMALAELDKRDGNAEGARKHLEAELKWFPAKREVRRELANVCMALKDWSCAVASFEELAKGQKKLPPAMRWGWSQSLYNLQEYEKARIVLDPALKGSPSADLLLLHANLLAKEGKREEGKAVFEKAQALKVKEVEAARKAAEARKAEQEAKGATPAASDDKKTP